MPKVRALGSADMKAAAEARDAAEKMFKDKTEIRRKIKALQVRGGYSTIDKYCAALGIERRRLRYILDNPDCIRLSEAVCIQVLAKNLGVGPVFDMVGVV